MAEPAPKPSQAPRLNKSSSTAASSSSAAPTAPPRKAAPWSWPASTIKVDVIGKAMPTMDLAPPPPRPAQETPQKPRGNQRKKLQCLTCRFHKLQPPGFYMGRWWKVPGDLVHGRPVTETGYFRYCTNPDDPGNYEVDRTAAPPGPHTDDLVKELKRKTEQLQNQLIAVRAEDEEEESNARLMNKRAKVAEQLLAVKSELCEDSESECTEDEDSDPKSALCTLREIFGVSTPEPKIRQELPDSSASGLAEAEISGEEKLESGLAWMEEVRRFDEEEKGVPPPSENEEALAPPIPTETTPAQQEEWGGQAKMCCTPATRPMYELNEKARNLTAQIKALETVPVPQLSFEAWRGSFLREMKKMKQAAKAVREVQTDAEAD